MKRAEQMTNKINTLVLALIVPLFAGTALAQVSEQEAARLGQDLTPTGAEQAGNADGTIPPWEGGITQPPAGYTVGMFHPSPWPDDQPLFTITSANLDQYRDKMTAGHIAMFAKYPDYKMRIYQTRRSASWPQYQYDGTKHNATHALLIADGEGVSQAIAGLPFPILYEVGMANGDSEAYQVMWNHKLHYRGHGLHRFNNQAAPTSGGKYTLIVLSEELNLPLAPEGTLIDDLGNILFYFLQNTQAPARLAGGALLVWETVDQVRQPRQAWVYNPGQRRVRRAPNIAYDNPGTASDGLRTNDMSDMFNGAMDRYNWTLVGKKEMYVPYNSYALHSGDIKVDDIIQPGYINMDLARYELHRVWVVEANLREGKRHINPRRTYYVDEDSWNILTVDHYDKRMELWRVSEAHCINYYDVETFWTTLEAHFDLQSGRYIAQGLDNERSPYDFSFRQPPAYFTPAALRKMGRR